MSHVSTADLLERLGDDGEYYLEVLTEDSLSVELARYPNPEPKVPHRTDELYYIIEGAGTMHVGSERHEVAAGDVVYVEHGLEHDFVDIEAEITALVIFASTDESVLGSGL